MEPNKAKKKKKCERTDEKKILSGSRFTWGQVTKTTKSVSYIIDDQFLFQPHVTVGPLGLCDNSCRGRLEPFLTKTPQFLSCRVPSGDVVNSTGA
ncbi:hypothetical protein HNY73_002590 [Argiope bruennichi]|uniref:Uncharacterized protein n=1 Tax=Argiope bruennichi TaxID=94029 RepID=A0A8T0FV33_ARGBR|nr:hypothetical protein HNY73_002590 [Argiope bruennichi]